MSYSMQLISSPLSSPLFLTPGTPCNGLSCHNAYRNDGLRDGEWNSYNSNQADAVYRLIAYSLVALVFLNYSTEDWISAPISYSSPNY